MQEGRSREEAPDSEARPGGRADAETEASVTLLVGALGRLCRYGAELAVLEMRERRRATVVVARLTAMAWLCLLTAWVGLNAALVTFMHSHVGLKISLVLLGAAVGNGLIAALLIWQAQNRWKVLKRSPLQALVK